MYFIGSREGRVAAEYKSQTTIRTPQLPPTFSMWLARVVDCVPASWTRLNPLEDIQVST